MVFYFIFLVIQIFTLVETVDHLKRVSYFGVIRIINLQTQGVYYIYK